MEKSFVFCLSCGKKKDGNLKVSTLNNSSDIIAVSSPSRTQTVGVTANNMKSTASLGFFNPRLVLTLNHAFPLYTMIPR